MYNASSISSDNIAAFVIFQITFCIVPHRDLVSKVASPDCAGKLLLSNFYHPSKYTLFLISGLQSIYFTIYMMHAYYSGTSFHTWAQDQPSCCPPDLCKPIHMLTPFLSFSFFFFSLNVTQNPLDVTQAILQPAISSNRPIFSIIISISYRYSRQD